jgi:hypothetical protein
LSLREHILRGFIVQRFRDEEPFRFREKPIEKHKNKSNRLPTYNQIDIFHFHQANIYFIHLC